jgi:hypothetical protein
MKPMDCNARERVLREGDPQLLESFELHAAGCADCARELHLWNDISAAARSLRSSWESPTLWPQIQQVLEAEAQPRARSWDLGALWQRSHRWMLPPVLASLLVLTTISAWLVLHRPPTQPSPEVAHRLLTERAVREVEQSEKAYQASIQKLSALAGSRVESPQTPLLAAYREKLSVLDSAIDDCRVQVNRNPANPQLREQLLSMYRQKQDTLRQVLQEE